MIRKFFGYRKLWNRPRTIHAPEHFGMNPDYKLNIIKYEPISRPCVLIWMQLGTGSGKLFVRFCSKRLSITIKKNQ